jgi:predicted Zn-dependent protease
MCVNYPNREILLKFNGLVTVLLFTAALSLLSAQSTAEQLRQLDSAGRAALPEVTIYVNIHFIGSDKGNFYAGTKDDWEALNGYNWALLMLRHANEILAQLKPSATSIVNTTGSARWRYELYSEPDNELDQHGGVFYWPDRKSVKKQYGNHVLHIEIFDKGNKGGFDGESCVLSLCAVRMYHAYFNAANKTQWQWWYYGRMLNHEVGHVLGLCHPFACENVCGGIDLDVAKECKQSPCYQSCGASPRGGCDPWGSGSTNMMGYNNDQMGLTPCQWSIAYGNLLDWQPPYLHFEGGTAPWVIERDTTLPAFSVLTRPVQVRKGARLSLPNGTLRLGADALITVEAGAELDWKGARLQALNAKQEWPGLVFEAGSKVLGAPASVVGAERFNYRVKGVEKSLLSRKMR